ncbi:hypothetical protein [Rubellicoccus peritrichatus]|uniref:Uncharacterized protein n=1 Tax=Rubellicoccus peritrichatus TaxID=3080537 RepID=A0AAQ3L8M5_9BACT|nr:hypothetical protein [Puniceicoccus sp. CR14]WOO41121.1 hypothetical protein RZN69_21075 [Puniceicoccus sp. CR14]
MSELTPEEERFAKELAEKVTSHTYRLDSQKRAGLYDAFEQKHQRTQFVRRWAFVSFAFACVAVVLLAVTLFKNAGTQVPPSLFVQETITIEPLPPELAWSSTDVIDQRLKDTRLRLSRVDASSGTTFFNRNSNHNQNLENRIRTLREDLS